MQLECSLSLVLVICGALLELFDLLLAHLAFRLVVRIHSTETPALQDTGRPRGGHTKGRMENKDGNVRHIGVLYILIYLVTTGFMFLFVPQTSFQAWYYCHATDSFFILLSSQDIHTTHQSPSHGFAFPINSGTLQYHARLKK